MERSEGLDFINRGEELSFLQSCLAGATPPPALVILRSPPGFGKSELTDQFAIRYRHVGATFCIVDPSIRSPIGGAHLYDGFFLQRCAEALSRLAEEAIAGWPTLSQFMHSRRWKTAREKKASDAVSELPTLEHAYRVAFDYAARVFGFGSFSPKQLLESDDAEAIRLCTEYVLAVLERYVVTLTIRESQHIDLVSLKLLLHLSEAGSSPNLIFEYTTIKETFEPEHEKLFMRAAKARNSLDILDLVRLEPGHLEYLIRRNVSSDFTLTSDFYLAWSGNLRSVIELKYRVSIGRRISGPSQIQAVLANLSTSLEEHILQLSPQERMVLAIVVAHVEAIEHRVLMDAFTAMEQRASPRSIEQSVDELVGKHSFLARTGTGYGIQNDSIASALNGASVIRPLIALGEKVLREYYAGKVYGPKVVDEPVAAAVRQVFRLSARTKDVTGLLRAVEVLTDRVRQSRDQSVYVEIVASAIDADVDLYRTAHDDLIIWAASLAYDIGDWSRCTRLLEAKARQDTFSLSMRACALQEIGRHDETLMLARSIRAQSTRLEESLIAGLLEGIVAGCRGDKGKARAILRAAIDDPINANSPLLGYAYRLFEIVSDYGECLQMLEASSAWFERFGFAKSRAYSQLAAAMMVARLGEPERASELIQDAERVLAGQVKNQHLILNNAAAVDLLRDTPDFAQARDRLVIALRLARDDFTELTILTNLALSYWGNDELTPALECSEKAMRILVDHDFEDRDIYWPVCFNLAQIYGAAGMAERREAALRFPSEHGRAVALNQGLWAHLYGKAPAVEPAYQFLVSRRRHPLYLSQWTIDVEGLNLLRQAPLQ